MAPTLSRSKGPEAWAAPQAGGRGRGRRGAPRATGDVWAAAEEASAM